MEFQLLALGRVPYFVDFRLDEYTICFKYESTIFCIIGHKKLVSRYLVDMEPKALWSRVSASFTSIMDQHVALTGAENV